MGRSDLAACLAGPARWLPACRAVIRGKADAARRRTLRAANDDRRVRRDAERSAAAGVAVPHHAGMGRAGSGPAARQRALKAMAETSAEQSARAEALLNWGQERATARTQSMIDARAAMLAGLPAL